jgi:type IV pilus assembly protein PilW
VNLIAKNKGFSLIELMVGLVIGLLATLVIMQVFSAFEGQKRSTSGSSDAQTNGTISLMSIQRQAQMAGYGLPLPNADTDSSPLKCTLFPDFDPDNNAVTVNSTNIFPLVITDGAGNSSDTIVIRYSNTAIGAVPVRIISPIGATSSAGMTLDNNIGCEGQDTPRNSIPANNIALIANDSVCRMVTVSDFNGSANDTVHLRVNTTAVVNVNPLIAGAKFTCMGDWRNHTYRVVNNELQLDGVPIASEVMTLQAQYGLSANANSNVVTQWVNATVDFANSATTPTVANRNRIKAIRVAIVMRNGLREKTNVSRKCSSTTDANPTGVCAWAGSGQGEAPTVDLTALPNWAQYRYRTFETIIPLRNMLWNRRGV